MSDWQETGEQLEGIINWLIEDPITFLGAISDLQSIDDVPPPRFVNGELECVTVTLNQVGELIFTHLNASPNYKALKWFFSENFNYVYVERFWNSPDVFIRLHRSALRDYRDQNSLPAMLLGRRYFVPRASLSVAGLHVVAANGDIFTGSAFAFRSEGLDYFLTQSRYSSLVPFLTCKHNVEEVAGVPYKGISIVMDNANVTISEIHLLGRIDACVLMCKVEGAIEPLGFSDFTVAESIMVAGYPRTHHMRESRLTFLEGMVNGEYDRGTPDHSILMSCGVAPGNSGGPVLNEFGSVIAMTHRSIQTTSIGGVSNFGSAIPFQAIRQSFLEP